jgi:DNA-directed RNA polymerase subunit RPC12/RpoP
MVKLIQTVTTIQRKRAKAEALIALIERHIHVYVTSYELQTIEVYWCDPDDEYNISDIEYYHDDYVETIESERTGYHCSICNREIDDPIEHMEEFHSDKLNEEIKVKLRQLK